jgi:hypothetical protein
MTGITSAIGGARTMDKKIWMALFGVLVISIVGTSALAMGWGRGNDQIQTAVRSGNYDAYVAAAENMTCQTLSEDQFNQMVERSKLEQPVMDARTKAVQAIKDNDFAGWKSAMITMIDAEKARLDAEKADLTQEKFDSIGADNDTGSGHMMEGFGMGTIGEGMRGMDYGMGGHARR